MGYDEALSMMLDKSSSLKHDPGHFAEKSVLKSIRLLSAIIVLIGAILPFLRIEKASLWLDEFWSIYFSDPSQPIYDLYRSRIIQELHPPLYFILNHFWMRIPIDSIYAPRFLSALCALGLLFFAAFMGRRFLAINARLFLLALIVTGFPFIHFSTEARNYMLAFLIGTVQAFIFHELAIKLQRSLPIDKNILLAFALISILNGFNHYYGFIYSGSLFAVLCILACIKKKWFAFLKFSSAGCVVFMVNGGYAIWALTHTRFSIHDNWIPGTLTYQNWTIREYLWLAIGGHHASLLIVLSVTVMMVFYLLSGRFFAFKALAAPLAPHILAIVIFLALALFVSHFWAPSITTRNLLVSVPSVWIASALAMNSMLEARFLAIRKYAIFLLLLTPLWGLPFALAAGGQNKEEWRESAAFVNSLQMCHDKNIPVYAGPRSIEHEFFFSFYLQPEFKMRPVLQNEPRAQFDSQCPIRLWTVRFLDEPLVKSTIEALGEKAEIVEFRNKRMWNCWLKSCTLSDAFGERMAIVVLEKRH
jgi:uncharacterized membrane protein